jgi:hypothetical protein
LPFRRPIRNSEIQFPLNRMGANMRRIVLICSAMLAMSVAGADAQSRLKRDDTQAAAQAAQPAATAPKKPNAAKRAGAPKQAPEKPAAPDTRPRLKRDDAQAPATAAAPAATAKKGRAARHAPTTTGQQAAQRRRRIRRTWRRADRRAITMSPSRAARA